MTVAERWRHSRPTATCMRAPVSTETACTRTLDHPLLGEVTAWLVGNRVQSPWHRQEAALYWIDARAPQLLRLTRARANRGAGSYPAWWARWHCAARGMRGLRCSTAWCRWTCTRAC